MDILAINCGSSSLKYQLFDWEKKEVIAKGLVERVTIGGSFIVHEVPGREKYRKEFDCPNHTVAMDLVTKTLLDPEVGVLKDINQIAAVGHRVVHGGEKFTCSVRIDDNVLKAVQGGRAPGASPQSPQHSRDRSGTGRSSECPPYCHFRYRLSSDHAGRGVYLSAPL